MKSSGRKALQPRNIFNVPAADTQLQLKRAKAPPPLHDDAKDNLVPVPLPVVESMDASLAEELNAFKKKLERLREDRERTEKLLEERDGALDLKMSQLLQRGEIQKSLEIQVDRLFRLKELHSYSSVSKNLLPLSPKSIYSLDKILLPFLKQTLIDFNVSWSTENFTSPISESERAGEEEKLQLR
ncbi:unnamed protein product, partial [Brassica napus]